MKKNKQIIDEINNIITCNYNNKEMPDKIRDIIKLLITNLDKIHGTDENNSNSGHSNSFELLNDSITSTNTNNPTINAKNAKQPTININNTNQPTININNTNLPTNKDSSNSIEATSGSEINDTTDSESDTTNSLSELLENITDTITQINTLKTQLCQLPLNPCESEYIDNNITPLITLATTISTLSVNLATSVNLLTTSPIVPRKKSKLKDTLQEIYDMNAESTRLYNIVKKRIHDFYQC